MFLSRRLAGLWISRAIIHDITSKGVKAVVPEYGELFFLLVNWLVIRQAHVCYCFNPAVNLSVANSVLSWFFPQIRKYRRSLIEVLLASLGASAAQLGSAPW